VHTHNESQEKLAHIRFTYIKPTKILLKSYVVILSRFSAAGSERFLPAVQFRRDTSDQEGPFSHSAILPEGVEQDSATIRRSSVNEIRYKRTRLDVLNIMRKDTMNHVWGTPSIIFIYLIILLSNAQEKYSSIERDIFTFHL